MKLTRDILALSERRKHVGRASSAFAERIRGKARVVWKPGDGSLLRLYRPTRVPGAGERAAPAQPAAPHFQQTILHARTVQNFFQTFTGISSASAGVDASGRPHGSAAPALRTRALQTTAPGTAHVQIPAGALRSTPPESINAQPDAPRVLTDLRVQDLIRNRDTATLRSLRTARRSPALAAPVVALRTAPRFRSFVDRVADAASAGRAPRLNAAEMMQLTAPPAPARLRTREERSATVAMEPVARSERAPDAKATPAALELRPDIRTLSRRAFARALADATEGRSLSGEAAARFAAADSGNTAAPATAPAKLDEAQVASAVRRALETSPEIAPEIFIDRISAKLERRLRLEREWRGVR